MNSNRVAVNVRKSQLIGIGIVEENVHDDYCIAFRGIPYVKPPVGKLRFKDPAPPDYGPTAVMLRNTETSTLRWMLSRAN
ncbi:esterase CM06B1-like [Nylanderia fulva]|uniref:esterase CM06B1-like n=1 Tax=Nylanderia fulva TaxID=613905 RepID=UPI0010FB2BF1|nr:esterase CM06B1-like [Nylanderia fulva]